MQMVNDGDMYINVYIYEYNLNSIANGFVTHVGTRNHSKINVKTALDLRRLILVQKCLGICDPSLRMSLPGFETPNLAKEGILYYTPLYNRIKRQTPLYKNSPGIVERAPKAREELQNRAKLPNEVRITGLSREMVTRHVG